MNSNANSFAGSFLASLAAGPVFLVLLFLAMWQKHVAAPIQVAPGDLLAFALILLLATFGGFLLSLLPNLLGALAMTFLGQRIPLLRSRPAWIAAGAGLGIGIAASIGPVSTGPERAFALIATAAICAGICRQWISFDVESGDEPQNGP